MVKTTCFVKTLTTAGAVFPPDGMFDYYCLHIYVYIYIYLLFFIFIIVIITIIVIIISPSFSKGRRKLGLPSKSLFYFESLLCSYPVFEGRLSQPMDHTIYSSFQPCLFELYYYGFQGTKIRARPSKEHTYLTERYSKHMFYSTAILWHCHAMVGLLFSHASSSKTCTIHTSHIGKVKLAKPAAGEKIHPCQVCKTKFSVSSGDPLTCLLLYELFPYLSREYY